MDEIKLQNYSVKKLLVLLSALYCLVFVINSMALGYEYKFDGDYGKRIEVNIKNNLIPEGRTLKLQNLESLINRSGLNYSYQCEAEAYIKAGSKGYPVKRVLSGRNLSGFLGLRMLKGSFFNGSQHEYGKKVAVISETLAEKLYMTNNVLGNEVEISGIRYKVTGVYQNRNTPFSILSSDGIERIYVPFESLTGYKDLTIETVFLKGQSLQEEIFRTDKVNSLLKQAGVNTDYYRLKDFYDSPVFISQPLSAFIFFVGILIMIILAKGTVRYIKGGISNFEQRMKAGYLFEVIKSSKLGILIFLTGAAFLLCGIAAVFFMVRFKGSIPYQYIPPDNIFDFQFYGSLIREALYNANEFNGYRPTQYELQVHYGLVAVYCLTVLLVISFIAVGSAIKLNRFLMYSSLNSLTVLGGAIVLGTVSGFILCLIFGIQSASPVRFFTVLSIYFCARLIRIPEGISLANFGLQK